jgi:hypothetical protein
MRARTIAALLWAAAACAPTAADSQPLTCEPASSPLLKVIHFSPARISVQPNFLAGELREVRLLCKDGRALVWTIRNIAPILPDLHFQPFPFSSSLEAGTMSPDSFASLQKAMRDVQIGFLAECQVGLDPLFGTQELKITWFGRGGRTNTFTMGNAGSAPPCPDGATAFVLALQSIAPGPGGSEIVIE